MLLKSGDLSRANMLAAALLMVAVSACRVTTDELQVSESGQYDNCTVLVSDTNDSADRREDGLPCVLRLTPTGVSLRADRDGAYPDPGSFLSRTSDGRFVTNSTSHPGILLIWNSKGEYVRSLGSPGRGPGEFSGNAILAFDVPSDTIVSYNSRRWTIFAKDSVLLGSIESTLPIAHARGSVALAPGGLVIVGDPLWNRSLSIVTMAGQLKHAFGDDADSRVRTTNRRRAVALADDSSFWAGPAPDESLQLTRWSLKGKRINSIRQEDLCCGEHVEPAWSATTGVARNATTGITVRDDGLLLVARAHTPIVEEEDGPRGDNDVAEVVLDVLDTKSRRVLARFGPVSGRELYYGFPFPFAGSNLAARRVERDNGLVDWEIVQITLESRQP